MLDERARPETRIDSLEVIDPSCGIRLANLDRALFKEVLKLYNEVTGAGLACSDLKGFAERELDDRLHSLRTGSSGAEWRLGSRYSIQSKLRLATIFERNGDRQNPVIYFWFNPNSTSGKEDAAQVQARNTFQTVMDDLFRKTGTSVTLRSTRWGPELSC